jgi:hypothetical protein
MASAFYSPESLAPGEEWRLLATDRFVAAFGPDTGMHTMATLWRIAAEPSLGLEALVGAVPTRGAEAVESFAIAAIGRSTVFVVRGGGCADVSVAGRMRRVDARGAVPWYVAELNEVDGFALGPLERSPGELRPAEADLPLDGGVVFGPWLGWARDVVASPPPRPPAPPAPVEQSAYDTNVLGDLGRRAASLTRHRTEPPPTAPTPQSATAFRVGDRAPERVDAPVYVGRQPRSPRVTGPMLPRLVRVDSPSREVSATHI